MFREEDATAVAVYFLKRSPEKKLNDLVLMKLMFMAERECMAVTTSLITGASFMSMQNGPVLSEVLNLMKGDIGNKFWSQHIEFVPYSGNGTESNHCKLKCDLDPEDYISQFDLGILAQVWQQYGSKDKWDLVETTHDFPEWDKTCAETKSSRPITLQSVYEKGFHKSHEEAKELSDEISYYETVLA